MYQNIPKFLKQITNNILLGICTFLLVINITPVWATNTHFYDFLPKSQFISQNYPQNQTLETGLNLYENGRYHQAIIVWENVLNNSSNAQEKILTLNYLSNGYQELGEWEKAESALDQSLNLLTSQSNPSILAQILTTQGNLQLATGQTEAALNTWQKAENIYQQINDKTGILGSKINQAQALQSLGLYRNAKEILESVNQQLQKQPDSEIKAIGLRSLGNILQVIGDLNESQKVLEQSLLISQKIKLNSDITGTLFSLGNTFRDLQNYPQAQTYYQQALINTKDALTRLQIKNNQLSLLLTDDNPEESLKLIKSITEEIKNITPSRMSVYALINFSESLLKIKSISSGQIGDILAKAVEYSQRLNDRKAEAYSVGQLGKLYLYNQQLEISQELTIKALKIAQQIRADDIIARWQAQLGKVYQKLGKKEQAIASYTQSVNILKSLRTDLVAINPDVQFSFRESIEPTYRELVSLLLTNPSQSNLKKARQIIETLQLAELDNFFRESCLNVKPQQIDKIDPKAVVIYPIILPDRLEVILSQNNQPLQHYTTQIPQNQIEETLTELSESLNPFYSDEQRLKLSQQVYNWLIKPGETELLLNKVQTLVFVLDTAFRNIPMSVLYDGKQYLIEKYNIALTPGLQLLPATGITKQKITAFTGGLSESRQGFSALPGVEYELTKIQNKLDSLVFLNKDFTKSNLQNQLNKGNISIVHLATHAQFSSNPEQTFILTYDEKIKVKDLETLLKSRETNNTNPIELLILSACQTATGDKKATLGLAGVAIRSGARSTLATLWSVKDESTALIMTQFYQNLLVNKLSKAEALRQSQLTLLKQPKFTHPFYWGAYILVGNWQ